MSDDYEAQQLVAAGLTLLQRSAPLVRALAAAAPPSCSRRRPPSSPPSRRATAAGRCSSIPSPRRREVAFQCDDAGVGAVFTNRGAGGAGARRICPSSCSTTRRARRASSPAAGRGPWTSAPTTGCRSRESATWPAATRRRSIVYTSAMRGTPLGAVLTHRNLLANARATVARERAHRRRPRARAAPLRASLRPHRRRRGAAARGRARHDHGALPSRAGAELLRGRRHRHRRRAVGVPRDPARAPPRAGGGGSALRGGALRLCICGGAVLPVELQDRWFEATGVELRQGYGLTEAGPVCLFNRVDRPNVRGTLGVRVPGRRRRDSVRSRRATATHRRRRATAARRHRRRDLRSRRERLPRLPARRRRRGSPWRDGWLRTGDAACATPTAPSPSSACSSRCSRATASTSIRARSSGRCASCPA